MPAASCSSLRRVIDTQPFFSHNALHCPASLPAVIPSLFSHITNSPPVHLELNQSISSLSGLCHFYHFPHCTHLLEPNNSIFSHLAFLTSIPEVFEAECNQYLANLCPQWSAAASNRQSETISNRIPNPNL